MKYALGIDAGVHTGIALYNRTAKKFDLISTTDFWDAYKTLSLIHSNCVTNGDELIFIVEDPNLVSHNWHIRPGQNLRVVSKIGENVGKNKAQATLWIDLIENTFHCQCLQIAHSSGKRYCYPDGKHFDATRFCQLIGWTEKIDEHGADAAALVWGI